MKTGLKRTTRHAHLTQYDGVQIDRTIYTDETGLNDYIKINGFVFDLWLDINRGKVWEVNFIW